MVEQVASVLGDHAIHWHPVHSGEESEISQPVSLTYLNRWKAFYPGKIIITVMIITIMKNKIKTNIIGSLTSVAELINFHFKTGCFFSTVNENR